MRPADCAHLSLAGKPRSWRAAFLENNMRSLLLLLPLLVPLSADAGTIATLTEHGGGQGINGSPVRMEFSVGLGSDWDNRAIIADEYTPANAGMTFAAPPQDVELFAEYFVNPQAIYRMSSGSPPLGGGIDDIWRTDWSPSYRVFTMHVPRLGVGLTGYQVTSVSKTIDRLQYNGNFWLSTMTIHIDGAPFSIPEPASWKIVLPEPTCLVLVLCGLAIHWRKHQ
jgi:hypothetical protein